MPKNIKKRNIFLNKNGTTATTLTRIIDFAMIKEASQGESSICTKAAKKCAEARK